ncbi:MULTISPECIES: hypothetical protein [Acetobacteraceae]|uniref:hypothetical protein n=1 Tax=Acetobacteraceae TaxID=433 RepID=UPI0039E831FD
MADDEEELGVIGSGYGCGYTPNHVHRKKHRSAMKLADEIDNPVLMWAEVYDYLVHTCILEPDEGGEEVAVSDVIIMPEMADFFLRIAYEVLCLAEGERRAGEVSDHSDFLFNSSPVLPKEAIKLLPQALSFTRRGYNAFAELAAIRQKIQEARLYDCLLADGLSSREALDALSHEFGELDHARRRKRIREGRYFQERHVWFESDDATFHHLCQRMKIDPYKNL